MVLEFRLLLVLEQLLERMVVVGLFVERFVLVVLEQRILFFERLLVLFLVELAVVVVERMVVLLVG